MNEGEGQPLVCGVGRGETVSEAVVRAVAAATGRPATPGRDGPTDDLDELFDAVDPDALDTLFRGRSDGRVVFYWSDCEIAVDGGTTVVVRPLR